MDFTFVPLNAPALADTQFQNPAGGNFVGNFPGSPNLFRWDAPIGPVISSSIAGGATVSNGTQANANASQTITLAATSGVFKGVSWQLVVGQSIIFEPNTANQEISAITSVNLQANQITCITRIAHGPNAIAPFLDVQRSLMSAENVPPQGVGMVALAAVDQTSGLSGRMRAGSSANFAGINVPLVGIGLMNPMGNGEPLRTTGAGRLETSDQDLLLMILLELKTMSHLLAEGLGTQSDPDDFRQLLASDHPLS